MNKNYRLHKNLNMTDFYTIETPPPSSSTSKDSLDATYRTKNRIKLVSTHLGQISNQSNSLTIKINEVREFSKISFEYYIRT